MDLEKIKRFANSEFEGWKIAKAVTEVKNEIKDAEQGRDVVMSDVFKTLREPLIEQQKKTDAKQDAVIDQLRQNQLALTGGFKDLLESNRDVLTLQQELPFPGVEAPPKEKPLIVEPNNLFEKDELKFIEDEGLIEPNDLLKLDQAKLNFLEKNVRAKRNAISDEIGALKEKKIQSRVITRKTKVMRKFKNFEQISKNNRKRFKCFPVRKERIRDQKIQTAKKKRIQNFWFSLWQSFCGCSQIEK